MDVLGDIVCGGLDVVFVGTSVGEISAQRGHHYSDPTNSFYRDLFAGGFTDRLLRPDEDHLLLRYGIGLTDLAKQAVSSDDRTLSESDWDRGRLDETIRKHRPRAVCFNGKKAFRAWSGIRKSDWGLQTSALFRGIPIFVVPSTSGRVPGGKPLGGRTRTEWFVALRAWLSGERSALEGTAAREGARDMEHTPQDDLATVITAEIVARFESERKAPYLDGDGYLVCGGRSGVHLIVYRRHNNPKPWPVPFSALREAVGQSCALGRPLRQTECNAICNRRGTPIAILLRLVPDSRYQTT